MSLKVSILRIVCIVHANDITANKMPADYTYHYLGAHIHDNRLYPVFVIMKEERR